MVPEHPAQESHWEPFIDDAAQVAVPRSLHCCCVLAVGGVSVRFGNMTTMTVLLSQSCCFAWLFRWYCLLWLFGLVLVLIFSN